MWGSYFFPLIQELREVDVRSHTTPRYCENQSAGIPWCFFPYMLSPVIWSWAAFKFLRQTVVDIHQSATTPKRPRLGHQCTLMSPCRSICATMSQDLFKNSSDKELSVSTWPQNAPDLNLEGLLYMKRMYEWLLSIKDHLHEHQDQGFSTRTLCLCHSLLHSHSFVSIFNAGSEQCISRLCLRTDRFDLLLKGED